MATTDKFMDEMAALDELVPNKRWGVDTPFEIEARKKDPSQPSTLDLENVRSLMEWTVPGAVASGTGKALEGKWTEAGFLVGGALIPASKLYKMGVRGLKTFKRMGDNEVNIVFGSADRAKEGYKKLQGLVKEAENKMKFDRIEIDREKAIMKRGQRDLDADKLGMGRGDLDVVAGLHSKKATDKVRRAVESIENPDFVRKFYKDLDPNIKSYDLDRAVRSNMVKDLLNKGHDMPSARKAANLYAENVHKSRLVKSDKIFGDEPFAGDYGKILIEKLDKSPDEIRNLLRQYEEVIPARAKSGVASDNVKFFRELSVLPDKEMAKKLKEFYGLARPTPVTKAEKLGISEASRQKNLRAEKWEEMPKKSTDIIDLLHGVDRLK